jgi:hypothetical protein
LQPKTGLVSFSLPLPSLQFPFDRLDKVGIGAPDLTRPQRRSEVRWPVHFPRLEEQQVRSHPGIMGFLQRQRNGERYRLALQKIFHYSLTHSLVRSTK